MSDKVSLIYTTFGSAEEARQIVTTLLHEKLIACANHLPPIFSQYVWEEEFHEEQEFPVLLKTSETNAESAMVRLKKLHGYETPAILKWAADRADPDYAKWLAGQLDR